MRVAKRFRWEAAHRLPWHEGPCRHLHGHSYQMEVVVEGPLDARGMVLDFKEVKAALKPLVEAWDHGTFVACDDDELLGVLTQTGWKHYVLPFDSTSENIAQYAAEHLCREAASVFAHLGVRAVRVRLEETETCYAEAEILMSPGATGDGTAGEGYGTLSPSTTPVRLESPPLHLL